MRDLPGKLQRLREMVEAKSITLEFALERAAAMGEFFERQSSREDLAEAVTDARSSLNVAVHRARREAHLRCEALLAKWMADPQLVDDLTPYAARRVKEQLRTSRPSSYVEPAPMAPLFDTSDVEYMRDLIVGTTTEETP